MKGINHMFAGVGRVLIVSSTERGAAFVDEMITQFLPETVVTVSSGVQARRIFLDGCDFDYVFINMPLSDETGSELALKISSGSTAAVMAIMRAETVENIGITLAENGIFTMTKPVVRANFENAVRLMIAAKSKIGVLEDKISQLHLKIEEVSIISRAKLTLIQRLGMSEAKAHRYLEKMAMDSRKKMRDVAAEILNQYDED